MPHYPLEALCSWFDIRRHVWLKSVPMVSFLINDITLTLTCFHLICWIFLRVACSVYVSCQFLSSFRFLICSLIVFSLKASRRIHAEYKRICQKKSNLQLLASRSTRSFDGLKKNMFPHLSGEGGSIPDFMSVCVPSHSILAVPNPPDTLSE